MRYLLARLRHSAHQHEILESVLLQPVIILRMQIVVDEHDRMARAFALDVDCDPVPICLDSRDYVLDDLFAVIECAVVFVFLYEPPAVSILFVVVVYNHGRASNKKRAPRLSLFFTASCSIYYFRHHTATSSNYRLFIILSTASSARLCISVLAQNAESESLGQNSESPISSAILSQLMNSI